MNDVVLVTGSSGLIGHALCERLARGYEVVGLDRPGAPFPPPRVDCIDLDLSSDESVRRALREARRRHGERIASAVHLAAYHDFSGRPNDKYDEINVRGTGRVLSGLREFFRTDQFLYASSMLVHAPCKPGQTISESWPLAPQWPYPDSKVRSEELVRSQRGDIPSTILRIAGVYDRLCHSVPLAQHIRRIYERDAVRRFFPGHGAHGQSFLHIDDLLDAIESLIERRSSLPPDLTLLLGEPEPVAYDELQHRLSLLIHGDDLETLQVPKFLARWGSALQGFLSFKRKPFIRPWMIEMADHHYALDVSLAESLLSWAPKHSLRRSLTDLVAAFKADPRGWYNNNGLEVPRSIAHRSGHDRRLETKRRAIQRERRGNRKDRRSQP